MPAYGFRLAFFIQLTLITEETFYFKNYLADPPGNNQKAAPDPVRDCPLASAESSNTPIGITPNHTQKIIQLFT